MSVENLSDLSLAWLRAYKGEEDDLELGHMTQSIKHLTPEQIKLICRELKPYRSREPVMVYRGLRNGVNPDQTQLDQSESPNSWSTDLKIAKEFASQYVMGTQGCVFQTWMYPEQMIVNTNYLPDWIYSHEECEIIAKPQIFESVKCIWFQ